MDQELLQALNGTLMLLSDARCSIEGETALLRAVNADLKVILNRLRSRSQIKQGPRAQQQLPEAAQKVVQDVSKLHAWGVRPAVQQAAARAASSSGAQLQRSSSRQQGTNSAHGLQPSAQHVQPRDTASAGAVQSGQQAAGPPQQREAATMQQLPASFRQMHVQYEALAGQVNVSSTTWSAAASFESSLQQAYGPSLQALQPQQQQPQHAEARLQQEQQWLPPAAFAEQAHFLGLVSAALWAIQKLNELPSNRSSSHSAPSSQQQLQDATSAVLDHCQQWLVQHSCRHQLQGQDGMLAGQVNFSSTANTTRSAAAAYESSLHQEYGPSLQLQGQHQGDSLLQASRTASTAVAAGHASADDVTRSRNRCLRGLLPSPRNGPSAAAGVAAHSSTMAAVQEQQQALQPAGLWLPLDCWQPLLAQGDDRSSSSSSSSSSNAVRCVGSSTSSRSIWQPLMPGARRRAAPGQHSMPAVATAAAASSMQPSPGTPCAVNGFHSPVLRCTTLSDMQQHSRQLQRLQQLLLQLAVESRAVPKLLELMLRGCMALEQQGARAAAREGKSLTLERCCALYRVVCGLAAGPVNQQGLGPSCQLCEEVEVAEAGLIDWD